MISTEEDDADEDYNEEKHMKKPSTTHCQKQQHRLAPLDHGSHTPLQPSPCAVTHTVLTSSFPTADESPPPLPLPEHDATQSPAVVRRSATPPHPHNAVCCCSAEAVAATRSACTGRNIETKSVHCPTASCDQTTLHQRTELSIKNFDYGGGWNLDSSSSASLNSKRALFGSNCSLNSDFTSALASQISSADDPNNTAHHKRSSSLPCQDHLECSPSLSSSHAIDAFLPQSQPRASSCSTTKFSHHHHRCISQCPSSATPRCVSPSVARKPLHRQDHATGISALDSTDRHACVDSSIGRTVYDTSSDGREICIDNNNSDSIRQLSSFSCPENVAAIPPLEQPLPPPSPPPPPDDTVPLLSPDLTAACPRYMPYAASQQHLFANNAEESEVANRCVNLQQSKRYSNNPGPVSNSMSYDREEPLSQTVPRVLIGSSKLHQMHHNGDACFGGREKNRVMDLGGDLKTGFSESFSYDSNKSSLLPQCASLTATVLSCKQDSRSHEPSEQLFKICNSVGETECYASSGVAALNCSVRHGKASSDLLCEPSSRNTYGSYACSAVVDFKEKSDSELLSRKNYRETPTSEHRSLPVALQTRCSNSSATIVPAVSSFSSCISQQHTSPSPPPPVVDCSSVRLDAKCPINSVQIAPNSLHRQARVTTKETPHPSTPTLGFNCTSCSSDCCKANEVDRPVSSCFDFIHDIPQSDVIVSSIRHSDSTVLSSSPPSQNPNNTSVLKSEASTASGLSPHLQESVRDTEGPPTSTTVGEDDQVILPSSADADAESCEGKRDSDSLSTTTGLVQMHSQSSQDSGIASVPLEECNPPPLSAALPTKTLTSMTLDSCSEDLIGSLECDVFPCTSATPLPCANTLESTISPSDGGAFAFEPLSSVHNGLLQHRLVSSSKWAGDHPSASPYGIMCRSKLDVECRVDGGPSSVSSSQPCSVSLPNSESSEDATLCPSDALSKEQAQHTQEPDQVVTVTTPTHQQHSLRRSTEVALDKTFEAFDSVITAHRSALKVLVPECNPLVGDVSILCLSDTSQILFEQDKSKANTSSIFSEDRTFYPCEQTDFSTCNETGASEQTSIYLHCRASPCTGASLVSVVASDGVMSNGDTGCSIIRQDNNCETSIIGTGETSSSRKSEAPTLSVTSTVVPETTLCMESIEPLITGTGCAGGPASSRNHDTILSSKLDQFASRLAKELVQESVLLSSTHAWNIRCSGQCRREQCRQDYYQSLLLLNASLENDPVAATHDYYSISSAEVKKGIYGSSGTKATPIYSSSSSSTYGRNSSSSVGSGGLLNSLTHHGGGDRRDSMHEGSGAVSGSGRTSAMVLALSSGGSPGLCWTPELSYASESGGKTVDDEEEYLSPRDSDNGTGRASSGSKKLFCGGKISAVVESTLGKRSPYKFQKTISTNTTPANLNLLFGRVQDISTEPEIRIEFGDLAVNISNELHHVINPRSPTDVISSTLHCPTPSLPSSLPPSLPASLPPSRSSLSPPPSLLLSNRPPGRHSRSSLSVSHDSLVCKTITAYEASLDDSHLITAAFSHDALHYGGQEEVVASASMLARNETCRTKQVLDTSNSESQHRPAASEEIPSSRLPSDVNVKEREAVPPIKECDSNSDMFCPRADPASCPVGKVSGSGGQKKKRRTKSRKRSSSRQQQCFSKSSSNASNQVTTTANSNEGKFYRKSRKHKIIDPSEVYSVPIDSIEEPGLAHPKAVIATQPRRHSHRKHRVTSSTITAGLPLINSSNIITNSNADVVSNSFGVGDNGVSDVGLSHSADLRVVIRGQASSKENKKKRFSSNKPSRAVVTSSVELSSPSSRQSIVSNLGCGNNNNKASVFSSPKQKSKHRDGKQSVASDPINMAADDLQKAGRGSSDHEVHSDTVHQTYSNSPRVSRKERHEHHSRICRILPFTALKSCKRKDHSSESRDDVYVAASAQSRTTGKNSASDQRKRGHSLFSNIRNSLLSLFSFGGSGGCDRSSSKEHKLRLKSSSGGVEALHSSTSLDSDSQAVISTSGSEVSADGCKGPTPAGPSAAIKSNDVTAVDLLNHSNYSAFTSAINVTSPRSAVMGAAGADASEGGRDRGGFDGLVLSPEEQNCHGDDALNKETLQRSNNTEAVIAALLVPPPLPPANDPTTNSNNPLHTAPSVSTSSVVTTSSAPLTASSALGCRSPIPVITNRALPPLPSAQPGSSVSNKTTNSIVNAVVNASTICSASPTPPPIPPPLPQSLLSAVGLPLPPPLPVTLRHSVAASIAAKASAAGAGESRVAMGRVSSSANSETPVLQAEKAGVFLVHGSAASVQEPLAAGERKEEEGCHFATMIEKVKDYGWYWGPISGKAAEKIISNEPDGSFIVRDSSDDHYIFSLTFKLNGFTRHVRIEHDQGNFSFGGYTKFKSQTIVEFIESAVEHSRSGRYLFFLHRRPVLGPMRVQLLHPVSRHRHIQSLQHLCRFVIVKNVRRDLLQQLPLPVRLRDYLTSPHYYSEQVDQCMAEEEEEQERVLQEAALTTGATGPEDDIQGQEIGTSEEATLAANSIQGQGLDNVPPLLIPLEIEPSGISAEHVNDLQGNREGQESVSLTNPFKKSMEPCNAVAEKQSLPSGVNLREGSLADMKPDSFSEAGSDLQDNTLLLGASGIDKDMNFRPVLQEKIQVGIGSKSQKRRSWDGTEGAAGGSYMASCSDSVMSGSCAVESPTLECHAVLEALSCLDESITQAEASIVAHAVCESDKYSGFKSYPHPSISCILSDNKCISAVPNTACTSQIISHVDMDSCSIPLTTAHSNESSCDSGATTRSLCSKSTTFPSSSAEPASGVSSKPPLSLSAYLHATPGKQIHKYKPGKIVSYQVDLASDSPTVIKLTKVVNQCISDEFRELNDSTTKENSVPASNGETDEDRDTISTRDCKLNVHCTREEHSLNPLHSNSGAELRKNVDEHDLDHLFDCCSVGGAVIGLVDLGTAYRNSEVDAITSSCSSEHKNTLSNSLIGHLSVLEESGVGNYKHSGAMVKSCENNVNDHIHEEAERTDHADKNENCVDGGQACSSSSREVEESSLIACHPTLQQCFVNSASSLPSVILNASLEELGSF